MAALDYELGYLLEPAAAPASWSLDSGVSLARFWRFERCTRLDTEAADAWVKAHGGQVPAGVAGLQATIVEAQYQAAVARIQAYIAAGDCYQVNYTFALDFDWFGAPLALYSRLRERQPVSFGGFIGDAKSGMVSLSPELFLERRGDRLLTRPMKGTAARSLSAEQLLRSTKDLAENLMIVDLLRNDLGRIAQTGSVRVERLFAIEDYPTVWQLVSDISARVPGRTLAAILCAMFPCGSITGAPKIRAMQIAAELEGRPRGTYTGALGWLAPQGDFRFNVAIRTLTLGSNGRGQLGLGSGIVADSQPPGEWHECLLKARFLCDCDPGLQLIETLRREGGIYPMWAGHLARLKRSAAYFGFPLDESLLCQALSTQPMRGTWRVRLTLDKAGRIDVQATALDETTPGVSLVAWAAQRIVSSDPLRRHKTTSRAIYDEALAAIADQPELFDIIFLNERGEVSEGARSSIFVERDGLLLTPPVSSGALPGVLRASLLADGKAQEAVLLPEDLQSGFWLGNALRGLRRARFREPT